MVRIGEVTSIFPEEGKVVVAYEDTESTSLPLPMLTMNNECAFPEVGEMVVTLHLRNGSSKGICLGTYFDEDGKGVGNYRKILDKRALVECRDGNYKLMAENISLEAKEVTLKCSDGELRLSDLIRKLKEQDKKNRDYEKRISTLESRGG